jgi:hypothetical protein
MTISLKLVDPDATIQKDINKAIAEHVNSILTKGSTKVKNAIKSKIPIWIAEQPEVKGLLREGSLGSLNAHFGLPAGSSSSMVTAILHSISESIDIKTTRIKQNLTGGIEFLIQPSDFANLLTLPEGHVMTNKRVDLHWLDWLLKQGSAIIVKGYEYTPSYEGRSGGGVMSMGSVWRVPPQFAGTLQSNFITRALSSKEKELTVILKGIFG